MANIVQQTSKTNHVNRSTFDLSGNINLTAAPGMLIPVRVDDCLPNSRYEFDMSLFARTVQMVVPSFARVRAHIDTFFVPYRLLGSDIPSCIVGDQRGMISNYQNENGTFVEQNLSLPFIDFAHFIKNTDASNFAFNLSGYDAAGISHNISSPILLNALGYGLPNIGKLVLPESTEEAKVKLTSSSSIGSSTAADIFDVEDSSHIKASPLYLLAYQKIYQDYYRNKLWEKENKASYYVSPNFMGKNMTAKFIQSGVFELRYHDYDKDRLTGLVPDESGILSEGISQYASSFINSSRGLDNPQALGTSYVPDAFSDAILDTGEDSQLRLNSLNSSSLKSLNGNIVSSASDDSKNAVVIQQYTALTNKRMEAFQKFAEICQLNKSDYKHQIKAHFGFTPSDLGSDYAQLIGSFDCPLSISDVENTTETNQGYLAGKGTMSGQSRHISFSTGSDYGCIMSILYILPQIDWSNEFVDRANLRFNRYDFAIPEFDKLGFEPVRLCDWFGFSISEFSYLQGLTSPFRIIGYLPRYWYYKTRLDVNTTGFSSSDKSTINFNSYVVQYDKNRLYTALKDGSMFEALKCRPSQLDRLFPTAWSKVEDNPFIITIYINSKAVLPLSIDSLPY